MITRRSMLGAVALVAPPYLRLVRAQSSIQPLASLVASTPVRRTLILDDGEYDDIEPIVVDRDLQIIGSRNAIVHSEFQITSGISRFQGFTLACNKPGAPHDNSTFVPFMQNGMITVRSGAMYFQDDIEQTVIAGMSQGEYKSAVTLWGAWAAIRSQTKWSRIDWANSPKIAVQAYYGSYLMLFDNTGTNQTLTIKSGATASLAGAAVSAVGSDIVLSGAHIFPAGNSDALYGLAGARRSYLQIGAGLYTTSQFPTPTLLDESSYKWVAPGCLG